MKKIVSPENHSAMRKLLPAGILAVSCMAALAGCGEEKKAEEKTENTEFSPTMDTEAKAEIRVQGSWSNFEALEAAAADWNEVYPNVIVNYNKADAYYDQLDRIVSAENVPEIVMFDTDADYVNKDTVVDYLVDLSEIGLNTDIFDSGILDTFYYHDKMTSLNWGMRIPGFVVNKTLLADLDLEIPKTQEDFQQVCDTLVEKGYTPLQGSTENVYYLVMQNDRDYHVAQAEDQETLYESFCNEDQDCGAYFEDEFSTMLDMVEKGYINGDVNDSFEDIYEMSILKFFEGDMPFLVFTTEGFSGMKKRETKSEAFTEKPFEYEFVSLPVSREDPVLSMAAFGGLAIVKDSENEKWAEEFLRFLCSDEELDKMAYIKGVPAVTKNGSDDERFAEIDAIPADRKIVAASYPAISVVEASFSDTLWKITCREITDVDEAESYFVQMLGELKIDK